MNSINNTKNKTAITLLLPSLIALTIYLSGMVGVTFAWITFSTTANLNSINTSSYKIESKVTNIDQEISLKNGEYSLKKDITYNIKITTSGNAGKGYVNVRLDDIDFKTTNTTKSSNKIIEFTITPDKDIKMVLEAKWGIEGNATIENEKNYSFKEGILTEMVFQTISEEPPAEEKNPDIPDIEENPDDKQKEQSEEENKETEEQS